MLATFLGAVAILTWDEIHTKQRVPHPEVYVHAAVVWAILGVAADLGIPELAGIFSIGLLLAMLYVYFQATKENASSVGAGSSGSAEGGSTAGAVAGNGENPTGPLG